MKFILLLLLVIVFSSFSLTFAYADHSEVTIIPASGSGAPGCEETSDGCYIPGTATVDVGGVVIMTNTDSAAHTYTSGTAEGGPDGVFDSSLLMVDGSYEWSPEIVGEYPYHCMVHPWMEGLIIVQPVESEEESSKVIFIEPTKLKFEPGEIIKFSGTALPNISIELVLEDPLGNEITSDILQVDDSGNIEYQYQTTQNTLEGTYTLIATQEHYTEFVYVGLGQLPTISLNLEFDKLNYNTSETANISLVGTSSSIISLLIIDPFDKPKGDAVSITLDSEGRGMYQLDLTGYFTGVYTAVVSKGSAQSTEIFTVGLQAGSADIDINTTKIEYQPGDSILVLGDTGANLLLTISLIDPDGNIIKVKDTFSDDNGKISDGSFRIPSDALSGTWQIKAQSGSNFDIAELQVGSITNNGLTVTVEDGQDIPGYGETMNIHIFGASQTVQIEIISSDGEIIEELSFPASGDGEINQPWIIPKDTKPGTYTITATDAFNSDSTTVYLTGSGSSDSPVPDIDDEITIIPASGSGAPGCEETADGCFIPDTAYVKLGGTVIFLNTDSAAHTFTAGTLDDEITGEFDTGLLMAGQSFEYQTTEEGEITYLCMVHPWMRGLLVVGDTTIPTPDPTPEPEDDLWGELGTIYHRYDGPYDFIQTKVTSNIIRGDVNVEQLLDGEIIREYTTATDHTGSFQFHRNITDDPSGIFEFRFLTVTNILLDNECYSWNGFDNPNNKAVDCDYSFPDPEDELEILSISTKKSSYETGDVIVITGKVSTTDFDSPLILQVFKGGSLVDVSQVSISLNETFSHTILAEGSLWMESGKYTVKASYGDDSEDTSFVFRVRDSTPEEIPETDDEITIIPASGSGAPGCEDTSQGCYIPSIASVSQGGVVIMKNTDSAAHTYTSGTPDGGPDGVFDSSLLMAGGSYEWSPRDEGVQPYFCMVHPWMQGIILVGEGTAPPPSPQPKPEDHVDLNIEIEGRLFDINTLVGMDVSLSGNSDSQNVAIDITDPRGTTLISRSIEVGPNDTELFEFKIDENFKQGNYKVTATTSDGDRTEKDAAHFKVKSQFNSFKIESVSVTDQKGNPSELEVDETGFIKVNISSSKSIATLLTVNIFDAELTSIGIGSVQTTLSSGDSEMILSFNIPDDAANGPAEIYVNAFSDWPSEGGVPLTGEVSIVEDIE